MSLLHLIVHNILTHYSAMMPISTQMSGLLLINILLFLFVLASQVFTSLKIFMYHKLVQAVAMELKIYFQNRARIFQIRLNGPQKSTREKVGSDDAETISILQLVYIATTILLLCMDLLKLHGLLFWLCNLIVVIALYVSFCMWKTSHVFFRDCATTVRMVAPRVVIAFVLFLAIELAFLLVLDVVSKWVKLLP